MRGRPIPCLDNCPAWKRLTRALSCSLASLVRAAFLQAGRASLIHGYTGSTIFAQIMQGPDFAVARINLDGTDFVFDTASSGNSVSGAVWGIGKPGTGTSCEIVDG